MCWNVFVGNANVDSSFAVVVVFFCCLSYLPHIFMVLVCKVAEWLSQAFDGRPKLSVVVIEKPWVVFCQIVT